MSSLHLHLEPVGGIAGDMFAAAMLDLFPDLQARCWQDLHDCGVMQHVSVQLDHGWSQGLTVRRFQVTLTSRQPQRTAHYADLRQWLAESALTPAVRERAQSVLRLLAEAEAQVHGVEIDRVHFHEVADWDSIVDVVAAASLIEHSGVTSWSCAPLPLGSGLVHTEHGMLPIPAPATAVLLQDMAVHDDGQPGERVTPTGAAILRSLLPKGNEGMSLQRPTGSLCGTGSGAGQRELADRPNVLRAVLIEVSSNARGDTGAGGLAQFAEDGHDAAAETNMAPGHHNIFQPVATHGQVLDRIAQLSFDVDDMTPEEVSVALDQLRSEAGVLDASFQLALGKKGRAVFAVTVLCRADVESTVSSRCLEETSTLGLRVQTLHRRTLQREQHEVLENGQSSGIKAVIRPDGTTSSKVESDDLAAMRGLQARRRHARQLQERFES